MFYELYRDQNVLNGGLWFDPDDDEVIQVTDMQSAAGETGVTLVERGRIYVTEEKLKKAAESAGMFYEEPPPQPPKGRKHWFSRPWSPPPKPGHLFWMPETPFGPRVMKAWEEWTKLFDAGGKFEELPEDVQYAVMRGAQAVMDYSSMDVSESRVVISKWKGAAKQKRQWLNAVISSDAEKAVWKILKEMGVRRNGSP